MFTAILVTIGIVGLILAPLCDEAIAAKERAKANEVTIE